MNGLFFLTILLFQVLSIIVRKWGVNFFEMSCKIRVLNKCFRLMGFDDIYFNKIKGVSDTQLYKQAGNSIVVNVLVAIFVELQKQYSKHIKIK